MIVKFVVIVTANALLLYTSSCIHAVYQMYDIQHDHGDYAWHDIDIKFRNINIIATFKRVKDAYIFRHLLQAWRNVLKCQYFLLIFKSKNPGSFCECEAFSVRYFASDVQYVARLKAALHRQNVFSAMLHSCCCWTTRCSASGVSKQKWLIFNINVWYTLKPIYTIRIFPCNCLQQPLAGTN